MYRVKRIYDFHGLPTNIAAAFVDRLYPRGIAKERMNGVEWLKEIAPSTELRRWYHENPEQRFEEFSQRYGEELQQPPEQEALQQLKSLAEQHAEVWLLTAVREPERSNVSVLLDYLGEPFRLAD